MSLESVAQIIRDPGIERPIGALKQVKTPLFDHIHLLLAAFVEKCGQYYTLSQEKDKNFFFYQSFTMKHSVHILMLLADFGAVS